MDLVAMANGAAAASNGVGMTTIAISVAAALMVFFLVQRVGPRLADSFTSAFLNNWRLGLLGLTGVVLSVASGWTTWDGMRNFTKEPVLSALITFGIQGVMLIVAWLIGESFATGMSHRPRHHPGQPRRGLGMLQPIASMFVGILLFSVIFMLVYGQFAPGANPFEVQSATAWWENWWDKLLVAAPILLVVALLVVNAGSDVLEDYMQSLRVMVRSAVLWVMFLACMATSVFFSFDSLFSTIFPPEERARAAELRAQNQVAGVVSDVARLAATRRLEEQERLFTANEWQSYEGNLERLARLAGGAGDKLQAFFEARMRERQQDINRFQEDKSSAAAQQVSLDQRKVQLNGAIGRLKEQVASLRPEVERLKALVFEKDREVIAKTAEAEAEAGGIGVTSKVGRGPKYREIAAELSRLREEKENLELQLREYEKRLGDASKTLTNSETELARIDGEIAKLRSRAETAARMIAAREKTVSAAASFDASTGVHQLADAREAFRRQPTAERLSQVQSVCTALAGALRDQGDPATQREAGTIDCDPGAASEAAARVFALNAGVVRLKETCVGGDKLPASGGADALFAFARRCVQDAQLSSRDTGNLRQLINQIELNRDDKAHRFVVTTNAFQDGNKLAYLALAIAIAIDTLVFMSGLFGANAVRSPLSDVPSYKGRSARQLEDTVENALLPDKFENAMHALEAFQPASPATVSRDIGEGWTHECVVSEADREYLRPLIKVLNAGATIGAVRRDETYPARYFVRGELIEFLNQIAKNAFERDGDLAKLAELRKVTIVALKPYVSDHADIVLGHMNPISDKSGFSSEIDMGQVGEQDRAIVLRTLNAGATLGYVERHTKEAHRDWFYIRNEFYRTLAAISADVPKTGLRHDFARGQIAGPRQQQIDGGTLRSRQPQLATEQLRAQRQLTHEAGAHGEGRSPADQSQAGDTLPDGQAPAATSEQEKPDAYVASMIRALGIEPGHWDRLQGGAFGRALQAGQVFDGLLSTNAMLNQEVRQRDKEIQERLDQAQRGLSARNLDPRRWDQIQTARDIIEQNRVAIMMLPGGPYEALLDSMIEAYERGDGDGRLDAGKRLLLHNVKAIRQALVSNPRDSAEAWDQLGAALEEIGRPVEFDPEPETNADVVDFKTTLRR